MYYFLFLRYRLKCTTTATPSNVRNFEQSMLLTAVCIIGSSGSLPRLLLTWWAPLVSTYRCSRLGLWIRAGATPFSMRLTAQSYLNTFCNLCSSMQKAPLLLLIFTNCPFFQISIQKIKLVMYLDEYKLSLTESRTVIQFFEYDLLTEYIISV